MTNLDDLINQLEATEFSIKIDEYLFERFVNGSPDRVLKAIESQVNTQWQELCTYLINVFTEINIQLKDISRANQILRGTDQLSRRTEERLSSRT